MSLPDLEIFTEALGKEPKMNTEKIDACLSHRKYLLNNMFECTPENVERLYCMANLVKDRVAMLHEKGNQLYSQTCQLLSEEKNPHFNDFYIEISICICFNDWHSILDLDDDNSGSDYVKMAEVLSGFYYDKYDHGNLIVDNSMYYDGGFNKDLFAFADDGVKFDEWDEPWFSDKFPELKGLPIVWEFHNLLFHGNYALQDIIRINDVWCEASVVWQHIAGQNIEK